MKKLKLALVIGSLLGCSFGLQATEVNINNYNNMTIEERESNFSKVIVKLNEDYTIQDLENFIGKEVKLLREASLGFKILVVEGLIDLKSIKESGITSNISISKSIKVERPIPINLQDLLTSQNLSNDPLVSQQNYLKDQEILKGASSISRAKEEKQLKNSQVRIGVVDTGVLDHEDAVFHDGENFATVYEARDRSDGYVDKSNNNDLSCVSGHGLAVSSIFGAIDNNSKGLSNIVDAQIVMARAIETDCSNSEDVGQIEDLADAIVWLAGGTVPDIPPLSEPVDVINLSIGGAGACDSIFQHAINYAVDNGVVLIAAAGNEDQEAGNTSPSNCDNIISVASNDNSANKSTFSNFGDAVDISAMGSNIYVAGKNNQSEYYQVNGTSMAAPIVSGISGLIKEKYEIVNQEDVTYLLKETATEHGTDFSGSSDDCLTDNRCGAGVANAYNAMSLADQLFGFETNISHYFQDFENCEQTTYLNQMINLGVNVCEMHNVKITEIEDYTDVKYQLIKREKAADSWTDSNTILVDEFFNLTEEKTFSYKLKEFEDAYEYGVRICDMNDNCFNSQDLDVSTIFKPEFCN